MSMWVKCMRLNGEPLEEVDDFKYLRTQVTDRINAKKCLYEGVIVSTALYGAEAWRYEKC